MNLHKSALILLAGLIIHFHSEAQSGWNWPSDPDLFSTAQEKQAFVGVSMQLENYQNAFNALLWLYQNNPNLHESIYIEGSKAIEKLLKEVTDEDKKNVLRDSLMIVYDMRMDYFGNQKEVMGRKAYAAFKLYYNKPAKYAMLKELYDSAYQLNPEGFASFNMTPYMSLAKYYHQRQPEEMTATEVLDIHEKISYSIEKQSSGQPEKMKQQLDKVDALLGSMGNILSCDFIGEKLAPRLEKDSTDLNTAKKIFSYSLKAKCTNEPFFLKAGKIVYDNQPTYELAKALGARNMSSENYDAAKDYFDAALEMTDDPEDLHETYINLANIASKSGLKSTARKYAYAALSQKPGDIKAYNIIGNLYFTSFNDCKAGISIVKDRAVFIAAYKMYEKAANQEQMAACKEQFPSSEEIFNEDMEVGQKVVVDCWISETVTVRRRD